MLPVQRLAGLSSWWSCRGQEKGAEKKGQGVVIWSIH